MRFLNGVCKYFVTYNVSWSCRGGILTCNLNFLISTCNSQRLKSPLSFFFFCCSVQTCAYCIDYRSHILRTRTSHTVTHTQSQTHIHSHRHTHTHSHSHRTHTHGHTHTQSQSYTVTHAVIYSPTQTQSHSHSCTHCHMQHHICSTHIKCCRYGNDYNNS